MQLFKRPMYSLPQLTKILSFSSAHGMEQSFSLKESRPCTYVCFNKQPHCLKFHTVREHQSNLEHKNLRYGHFSQSAKYSSRESNWLTLDNTPSGRCKRNAMFYWSISIDDDRDLNALLEKFCWIACTPVVSDHVFRWYTEAFELKPLFCLPT